MTVGDLKKLMKGVKDDVEVLIPMSEDFDGMFTSPCIGESGLQQLGIDEETEETVPAFLLAPHGFFEIDETEIDHTLN